MAEAKEGHTGSVSVVDDFDAISRVLQKCTEGEAKGDVAKLKRLMLLCLSSCRDRGFS
jgi:hypothetical protein